jgi:hypothetical protein
MDNNKLDLIPDIDDKERISELYKYAMNICMLRKINLPYVNLKYEDMCKNTSDKDYKKYSADDFTFMCAKYPVLILNNNHHSCSILGHPTMLKLDQYQIVRSPGNSEEYPKLKLTKDTDTILTGIELQRKICENAGCLNITDEQLYEMINSHRNCPEEL